MRLNQPVTGREFHFPPNTTLMSTTDTSGRITYANDVFCRVSALPEAELLGRPHSVIRHPEMPKAVFKLLWDTLGTGQELFEIGRAHV